MKKLQRGFGENVEKEYMISLRESYKMKTSKRSLKIDVVDAVSIFEVGLKRRHWKVGKVLRIIRGKDDVIRGAVAQIFNKKTEKKPSADHFRNRIH